MYLSMDFGYILLHDFDISTLNIIQFQNSILRVIKCDPSGVKLMILQLLSVAFIKLFIGWVY